MKINSTVLSTFLNKISLNGEHQIDDIVLNFSSDGLKTSVMSEDSTIRVDAVLPISNFTDYEEVGRIGLQEISKIISILKTFNNSPTTLLIDDNSFTVKGKGRKVEIPLIDIQFLDLPPKISKLEFDENLSFPVNSVQKTLNDMAINKTFSVILSTEAGLLNISNKGKFKFTDRVESDQARGGVKVEFQSSFVNAIKNLTGTIQLSIGTDYPCRILEKTEESMISLIVAPSVSEA